MKKIQELIQKLNDKGIPLPILRDMVTGKPSITYTTFIASTIMYILSLFQKAQAALGGIDKVEAGEFFLIAAGIYLGRAISRKQTTVAQEAKANENSDK